MATMQEIEKTASAHANHRRQLGEIVRQLEAEIAAARKKYMPVIVRRVELARASERALKEMIAESAALFERPRTVTIDGVRIGFMKGKGTVTFQLEAAEVAQRIRRHLPDRADVLIKVKETPIKAALADLDVATLKKIGYAVSGSGDQVLVKPVDGEIDKLVAKLLEGDRTEEDEE